MLMKANISPTWVGNAQHEWNNKELTYFANVVALYKGGFEVPIKVRWYVGRYGKGHIVYCNVWIDSNTSQHTEYRSGSGKTPKHLWPSHGLDAPLEIALNSAGITLSKSIVFSRQGWWGIEEALFATAHALGYRKIYIP